MEQLTQEQKAQKWDDLRSKVVRFYQFYPDGTQLEEGDVRNVGEITADAFGFHAGYQEPAPMPLNVVY